MLERDGDALRLSGDATGAQARRLLEEGTARLDGVVRVDLAGVSRADSATLAVLVGWAREAQARGRRLAFTHPPAALASLAELYGLAGLFGAA